MEVLNKLRQEKLDYYAQLLTTLAAEPRLGVAESVNTRMANERRPEVARGIAEVGRNPNAPPMAMQIDAGERQRLAKEADRRRNERQLAEMRHAVDRL